MPLEDCLEAAIECNAPMVSICGGEPLIYPQIEKLRHDWAPVREEKDAVAVCSKFWLNLLNPRLSVQTGVPVCVDGTS